MNIRKRYISAWIGVLAIGQPGFLDAQPSNVPPEITITWPADDCFYTFGFEYAACFKIEASAKDLDGSIDRVEFFSDNTLIGVVSNAPFAIAWKADPPSSSHDLKAVAFDNLGASGESQPVFVSYLGGFATPPVFEITSPSSGSVFASPATFLFTARLLSSPGCGTGPVEFFAGTNSLGIVTQAGPFTVTTPPYSLTATNLPEGEYHLTVRRISSSPFSLTYSFAPGSCNGVFIHVSKLGMNSPRLTPDGRFELDVVTSFPTNQHVIEASSDLLNWTPISTNVPFTNTFLFTDPSPAANSPRFYRAVVTAP